MKRLFAVIILSLAFALSSGTALAATKQTVSIPRPVVVGGVTLAPGNYDMTWSGDSSVVQVTFTKDKKTVVTSPARYVSESNKLGGIGFAKRDGVDVLQSVSTKNASLFFDVPPAAAK